MSSIATLSQQAQTFPGILLFDVTSVEDGTVLHLSQIGCTYGGNTYQARVLSASGFEQMLESSPLGIMAIPDITLTLGDADGGMTAWDNSHVFKNAKMTVTYVMWNPSTKSAASSDSRTIGQFICHPLQESSPETVTLSAYNRFNAQFSLLPADRVSVLSQTNFPLDGMQDCDDANASAPANLNSVGYAMRHGESSSGLAVVSPDDVYLPYFSCGYGPLRGTSGWAGGHPLGNFLAASVTATAALCSASAIGNSGAAYGTNALANHVVVIVSGTGAGQARRIASNTTTQITVAKNWTTAPDGTSVYCVLYGFCPRDAASCQARGMYSTDSSARSAYRNRAITYVPTNDHYRSHPLTTNPNQAKYNQPIPLVYGTAMVPCQVLFAQSSSKVTTGELLVCTGPISWISQFIVGNTIVPYYGTPYPNDGAGSYRFKNQATGQWTFRRGLIGDYFLDPYYVAQNVSGGLADSDVLNQIAMIMFQVPVQFGDESSMQALALVQGLQIQQYDANGNATGNPTNTSNPAWIILDLLRRSGWQSSEINFASFYAFSVYANQLINVNVSSTQTTPQARFSISPIISQQAPASEVLHGVLTACRGLLSFDSNGLLRIDCENRITNTELQASITSTGAQWIEVLDGAGISIGSVLTVDSGGSQEQVTVTNVELDGTGYYFKIYANFAKTHSSGVPVTAAYSYSFDLSSICQAPDGSPDLKRSSLKSSETPNQFLCSFQDALRDYVEDNVTLSNPFEVNQFGATVVGDVGANGVQSVDAAVRLAQLSLYKAHGRRSASNAILSRGNLFVELCSSVKAIDVKIGSICQITYSKENWTSKSFRVVQVSPTQDSEFAYWKIKLTLREHDDGWYDDINGNIAPAVAPPPIVVRRPGPRPRRFPSRPILKTLSQATQTMADGNVGIGITVPFIPPQAPPVAAGSRAPAALNLATGITQSSTGGTLSGGQRLYYSFTAIDANGEESLASQSVEVVVPSGTNTNQVTLTGVYPFDANAVKYRAYRSAGDPLSPLMIQDATAIPASGTFTFTDTGLATSDVMPPAGESFSVRSYWRKTGDSIWKLGAETPATIQVNDSFDGTALSSDWTTTEGSFVLSGNAVEVSAIGGDSRASAVYTGSNFTDDQYAELVIASAPGNSGGVHGSLGPAVRMSSSAETYYAFYCNDTTAFLFKVISGTTTVLASVAHTPNVGDVLSISVQGTSLTAEVNGAVLLTATDSSISSGYPGIAGYAAYSTSNSGNDFFAGNILGSLSFVIPLNVGGQSIDVQLRTVSIGGLEMPEDIGPTTTYATTSPSQFMSFGSKIGSSPFSYSSTTTSITISWKGFTVYKLDGTTINISDGSQTITGLQAGTTYSVYPYLNSSNGISFILGTDVTLPTISGVDFTGAGEVTTATSTSENGAYTLEAWVYVTATPASNMGFILGLNANQTGTPSVTGGPWMAVTNGIIGGSSGSLYLVGSPTLAQGWNNNWSSSAFAPNEWHHLVITFAGGSSNPVVLYVDGVGTTTTGLNYAPNANSGYWRIGRGGSTGSPSISGYFNGGVISRVAVYGKALTSSQVSNHYNQMLSGTGAYDAAVLNDGPQYFWKLNETSGTSAADSESTNTGTYAGTYTLNDSKQVGGANGSPAAAFQNAPIQVTIAQFSNGRVPLLAGGISLSTPSSGSGGGISSSFFVPGLPTNLVPPV